MARLTNSQLEVGRALQVLRHLAKGAKMHAGGMTYGMDDDGNVGLLVHITGERPMIVRPYLTVGQFLRMVHTYNAEIEGGSDAT